MGFRKLKLNTLLKFKYNKLFIAVALVLGREAEIIPSFFYAQHSDEMLYLGLLDMLTTSKRSVSIATKVE